MITMATASAKVMVEGVNKMPRSRSLFVWEVFTVDKTCMACFIIEVRYQQGLRHRGGTGGRVPPPPIMRVRGIIPPFSGK